MDTKLVLIGLIEIISSLVIGVLILFLTYKFFIRLTKKQIGLEQNNIAFHVFMSGVLFAVGYTISGVIQPIITAFRLLSATESSFSLIVQFLSYALMYVVISFVISIAVSLLGTSFYNWLTPKDEFKELEKNNIGVAILTATIIIVLALMSRSGVVLLIESFVPYPELPPR